MIDFNKSNESECLNQNANCYEEVHCQGTGISERVQTFQTSRKSQASKRTQIVDPHEDRCISDQDFYSKCFQRIEGNICDCTGKFQWDRIDQNQGSNGTLMKKKQFLGTHRDSSPGIDSRKNEVTLRLTVASLPYIFYTYITSLLF